MLAVIETGAKQYIVKKGDVIQVEKLDKNEGENVTFDKVLLLSKEDGGSLEIGQPYLEGKVIEGKIVEQKKADKIVVFKYKPKKRYKKKQGHRQRYTMVEISKI